MTVNKISEIISLVTNGYTIDEIKALSQDARASTAALISAGLSKEDAAAAVALLIDEPAPEQLPDAHEDPAPSEPEPDYRALYEESQRQLVEAHKLAARQPAGDPQPERTAEDVLADMAKQYII